MKSVYIIMPSNNSKAGLTAYGAESMFRKMWKYHTAQYHYRYGPFQSNNSPRLLAFYTDEQTPLSLIDQYPK